MANTKISALPASTTPLAGTEVLPIVQSSTTRQVSVANLTAGRAVATGPLTVTGAATVSTTLGVTGATTLSAALTYGGITLGNAVTGTGKMVLDTSPTLVTPTLGVATATSLQGIIGNVTPAAGAFTTVDASGAVTLSGGTANGVTYLNGSKVLTSGSGLVFDGTNLGIGGAAGSYRLKTVGAGFVFTGTNYFNVGIHDGSAAQRGVAFGYESGSQTGIIAAETSGAASTLAFYTFNGSAWGEQARIDSSGRLFVGVTTTTFSSSERLEVNGSVGFVTGTGNTNLFCANSGTGSQTYVAFYVGTTGTNTGNITTNGTTTTYATTSDYRLKDNVIPMTGALAKVAQLKPVNYKWKADGSDGQGFIAHELQAVVPDCVTGEKDAINEDGKPRYQGVDTSFLVATLTAAIQEQQALIQSLKARLDAANL